jgi:hypothetical protein
MEICLAVCKTIDIYGRTYYVFCLVHCVMRFNFITWPILYKCTTVNIRKPDKSGFRMVNLRRVVEWSSFLMVRLDRFIIKKKLWPFLLKRSRLVLTIRNRTNLSGFRMVGHFVSIWKLDPKTSGKWPFENRTVRFLVVHCNTLFVCFNDLPQHME